MDITNLTQEIEQLKSADNAIKPYEEDELLAKYKELLMALRKDGVNRITELRQDIVSTKKNKMLEPEERNKLIQGYKAEIEKAKEIANKNKALDKQYTKEAVAYSNTSSKLYIKQVNEEENAKLVSLKKEYLSKCQQIKLSFAKLVDGCSTSEERNLKNYEMKSALADAKKEYESSVEKCRSAKNQVTVDHVQSNRNLRNGCGRALRRLPSSPPTATGLRCGRGSLTASWACWRAPCSSS